MLWFMGSQRVGHDWATELTDCKIQNILMHLKCVHSHGDTMEIKYFILWLVPEHLSSESFIHSILYTFLLDIFPCSALHFFFFPIFFFYFIDRGISFQILVCIFVTVLCIALGKPLDCCFVLFFSLHFHSCWQMIQSSIGNMGSNLCHWDHHLFLPNVSFFKLRNQFLKQKQIIITCQLNKALNNIANWKKC